MKDVWNISDIGLWRFTVFHIASIIYFYFRWSAKNAQHKTFHFLILWTFIIKVGVYAYQLWVTSYNPNLMAFSWFWYQLIMNVLFELSLILVFVYGILFRRAQIDKGKFRNDVAGWFGKARKLKSWLKNLFKRDMSA